jgi:hypothetical protein
MGNHLTPAPLRVNVRAFIAVVKTVGEDEVPYAWGLGGGGGAFWIISLCVSFEVGPLSLFNIWTYDEKTSTSLVQTAQAGG